MFINDVKEIYRRSRRIGLVRSGREFSIVVCGRRAEYYRHCRSDEAVTIPLRVAAMIVRNLHDVHAQVSGGIAAEMDDLLGFATRAEERGRIYRPR